MDSKKFATKRPSFPFHNLGDDDTCLAPPFSVGLVPIFYVHSNRAEEKCGKWAVATIPNDVFCFCSEVEPTFAIFSSREKAVPNPKCIQYIVGSTFFNHLLKSYFAST